jgi:NhaC family Na+:H+ antiporter
MSPLSETTILVPSLIGGVTVQQHIRTMLATTGPAILLALLIFLGISLTADVSASAADIEAARATLGEAFNISVVCVVPLILLIVFSVIKFPAFLSIYLTAIFSGVLAVFTQRDLVIRFAGDPTLSEPMALVKGIYAAMATGFVSTTGIESVDALFSRGGMSGMLTTVWLILGALGFGAIMEQAGFLDRLIHGVLDKAKSGGALAATVIGSAFGLNLIAADQYIAIVLPSRMFRLEFKKRGYKPYVLARIVEDSGTVTSVLIPWNTCGAYHAGVLGISTFAYLPYCFFNIINPILSLIYGFTGFSMDKYAPGEAPPDTEAAAPQPIEETVMLQPTGEAR